MASMHRLAILSPCTEDWNAMHPERGGRYCDECGRVVHDLSARTKIEARALAALFGGDRFCVRVTTTPSGRVLYGRRAAAIAAGAVAAAVGTACAPLPPPPAVSVDPAPPPPAAAYSAPPVSTAALVAAVDKPADRDGDGEADSVDACPDVPGKHSVDPKKNGCPEAIVVTMGEAVIIEMPHFAFNKTTIEKATEPILDEVAKIIKAQPEIGKVRLTGHASSDEPDPNKLAKSRAQSVQAALVARGVDAARLDIDWKGSTEPIAGGATADARAKNRRVQFSVEQALECPAPANSSSAGGI